MLCKIKRVFLINDAPTLHNPPPDDLFSYPQVHITKEYVKVKLLEVYAIFVYLDVSQIFDVRLRLSRIRGLDKSKGFYRGNRADVLDIVGKVIKCPYPGAPSETLIEGVLGLDLNYVQYLAEAHWGHVSVGRV